jgi:hypothetical protein
MFRGTGRVQQRIELPRAADQVEIGHAVLE